MTNPAALTATTVLRLKKGEERRLRAGHLWVYSNEIDVERTPLRGLEPGQAVRIESASGKALGSGYANPHSLICARLVSRDARRALDRALIAERLRTALDLRERLYARPFYRLAFGEADGLPGLVIDRYGEICVAQLTTAGMDARREQVLDAIREVCAPRAVVWRNDSPVRDLEGLGRYVEVACGEVPETVELEENGWRFRARVLEGQKTGWFFDHRENRARMARYAPGARVLDAFSYAGAWAVQALAAGAGSALCVDASQSALQLAAENAALNGLADRLEGLRGDVFEVLAALRAENRRFDLVILDPPAFVKRKKDLPQGSEAYRRLNQAAMQLLEPGGVLISASCSHHLARESLVALIERAARHLGLAAQLLEHGHQAPDHPVHPAIPETAYLKAVTVRVLPGAW